MTRAVLPTPATPSYCAAMTVGTMVKRFAHVRFLVDCLWVQPLFTLSVPRDIFRTPALIWGRFIDSGNQVGRTRSDIQAAGPRRCQSQIVLLLLGCKAGLISSILVARGICARRVYTYVYMFAVWFRFRLSSYYMYETCYVGTRSVYKWRLIVSVSFDNSFLAETSVMSF